MFLDLHHMCDVFFYWINCIIFPQRLFFHCFLLNQPLYWIFTFHNGKFLWFCSTVQWKDPETAAGVYGIRRKEAFTVWTVRMDFTSEFYKTNLWMDADITQWGHQIKREHCSVTPRTLKGLKCQLKMFKFHIFFLFTKEFSLLTENIMIWRE